jgi:biopolymer transport protein ExbD
MPLLDVVFLLLTFFAFALLMVVRADVLDVRLPVLEAGRSDAASVRPVVVTVLADGAVAVDAVQVESGALAEAIRRGLSERPGAGILLEIDAQSPSGRLIELVQTLRAEGFEEFGILGTAAQPGGEASGPSASAGAGPRDR